MSYKYDQQAVKNDKISGISLLLSHKISTLINLFLSTFLVAYIYQFSNGINDYIFNVGMYEFATYLTMGVVVFAFGYIVEKSNRVWIFRLGAIAKSSLVVFAIFFGEQLATLIPLAGFLNGLSMGIYYASFNVIRHEMVGKKTMKSYVLIDYVLTKTIEIVLPVTLGLLISVSTYAEAAVYVFAFCVVQIVLTFFIKSKRPENSKFSLTDFSSSLEKNVDVKKRLNFLYIIHFFYGFVTIITSLLSVCIMLEFGSSFSLGIIISLLAILTVISAIIFKKFTKPGKRSLVFILASILPVAMVIVFVLYTNVFTLICYNVVINLSGMVFRYVSEAERFSILKEAGLYDFISEHHTLVEIILSTSRIISSGLLMLFAMLNTSFLFEVYLVIAVIVVSITPFLLFIYEKKYYNNMQQTTNSIIKNKNP